MQMEINNCPLLQGFSDGEIRAAMTLLDGRVCKYDKGELLNRAGAPLPGFGYVLCGCIQVTSYDYSGLPMIMATVEEGGSFGEALSFLKTDANIYISAIRENTAVLWLSPERLTAENDRFSHELLCRFAGATAKRLLLLNDRIQVLSKHTLREKILTYLSQYAVYAGSESFEIPMDREHLSVFLGCERSALSRELSRLSREGILSFKKNRFTLHRNLNVK